MSWSPKQAGEAKRCHPKFREVRKSEHALLGSRDGKVGIERTRDGIRRRETGERNRIVAMLKNSAARFERCSEGRVPTRTGIDPDFDFDPDPDLYNDLTGR